MTLVKTDESTVDNSSDLENVQWKDVSVFGVLSRIWVAIVLLKSAFFCFLCFPKNDEC